MSPYVAAFISMLSVVIGASLQFWFSRSSAKWSHIQDKRTQAYVDFLKAVAGLAQAQKFKDEKTELDFASLLADARARITVFGHSEVINALAKFDKSDRVLESQITQQAFIQFILTMRKVSNVDVAPISGVELYLILFGNHP